MSLSDDVKELQTKVGRQDTRIKQLEGLLANFRNAPIIHAYVGKRLILNAEIDAQRITSNITDLQSRVTALE